MLAMKLPSLTIAVFRSRSEPSGANEAKAEDGPSAEAVAAPGTTSSGPSSVSEAYDQGFQLAGPPEAEEGAGDGHTFMFRRGEGCPITSLDVFRAPQRPLRFEQYEWLDIVAPGDQERLSPFTTWISDGKVPFDLKRIQFSNWVPPDAPSNAEEGDAPVILNTKPQTQAVVVRGVFGFQQQREVLLAANESIVNGLPTWNYNCGRWRDINSQVWQPLNCTFSSSEDGSVNGRASFLNLNNSSVEEFACFRTGPTALQAGRIIAITLVDEGNGETAGPEWENHSLERSWKAPQR